MKTLTPFFVGLLKLILVFLFGFQVRKYLIPDSNDEIRQEQMREMELLTTAQTNAPNLSPSTSKNPLSVTNSDGQDDIGSDETGSNSSAQVRKNSQGNWVTYVI